MRDHSLAVGFGSRSLAALVSPAAKEDAFIAGLLHDAGKIMLSPNVAENQLCLTTGSQDAICDLKNVSWNAIIPKSPPMFFRNGAFQIVSSMRFGFTISPINPAAGNWPTS
jgi:hypothetical protein